MTGRMHNNVHRGVLDPCGRSVWMNVWLTVWVNMWLNLVGWLNVCGKFMAYQLSKREVDLWAHRMCGSLCACEILADRVANRLIPAGLIV